ncbi:30S ribosomal protein S20, partial [Patescibacteria group bacterium]|nr:30S ribosomal protein S20 [Patescibacteria group bacterium]
MPITSSAKKALRSSLRKRAFNLERKNKMKSVVKEYKKLITEKKMKEAGALLPKVYKEIDKTAKRGVIKKNAASRKKSRFANKLKTSK